MRTTSGWPRTWDQLLLELIPGGATKGLSAAQAKALLASVRPRDVVGMARRRVAAELIGDLERVYQRTKLADKELTQLLEASGTTLMDLHGRHFQQCSSVLPWQVSEQ